MNVTRMLATSCRRHTTAVAVVDDEVSLSYTELLRRTIGVARQLIDKGIMPGDRVGILLPNGVPYTVSYLAVHAAGGIAVLVNSRLTVPELTHVLSDARVAAVITDASLENLVVYSAAAVLDAHDLMRHADGDPKNAAHLPGWHSTNADVAQLLYTSGTTGRPKGAMQTHGNLMFNIGIAHANFGIGPETATLIVAPMFHATGVNSQLLPCLAAGARSVLALAFHPVRTLDELARHQITLFGGVAAMIELLALDDRFGEQFLPCLRTVGMGGSPVPPSTLGLLAARLPHCQVVNVWGLTEATSIVTTAIGREYFDRPWTAGRAVDGVEVIVARGRSLEPAPPGTVGELLVRGPGVTAGYWERPEATAATFEDGWLRTGDVGRIDEQGFVQVLDRLKDMIIRGGENIYCLEVENALTSHAGVAEAAVVGVPHPIFGEQVKAVVAPVRGVKVTERELAEHIAGRLADYKRPVTYEFVEALPRNASGKVVKRFLVGRG